MRTHFLRQTSRREHGNKSNNQRFKRNGPDHGVPRGNRFQPKLPSGGADEHSPRGEAATSPVIISTHSDPVLWDNRPPTSDDENGPRSEWIFAGCDSGVAF